MTNCQIGRPGFDPMQCQPCQPCMCPGAQAPMTMVPAYNDAGMVTPLPAAEIVEDGGYNAYGCAPCMAEPAPEM